MKQEADLLMNSCSYHNADNADNYVFIYVRFVPTAYLVHNGAPRLGPFVHK